MVPGRPAADSIARPQSLVPVNADHLGIRGGRTVDVDHLSRQGDPPSNVRVVWFVYIHNVEIAKLVHARLRGMVFTTHTNTPFKLFGGCAVR